MTGRMVRASCEIKPQAFIKSVSGMMPFDRVRWRTAGVDGHQAASAETRKYTSAACLGRMLIHRGDYDNVALALPFQYKLRTRISHAGTNE